MDILTKSRTPTKCDASTSIQDALQEDDNQEGDAYPITQCTQDAMRPKSLPEENTSEMEEFLASLPYMGIG